MQHSSLDSPVSSQSFRILIVEDNETDIDLLESMIGKAFKDNYECIVCRNIAETKKVLRENPPDFIILDLMLPDSQHPDTLTTVVSLASHTPTIVYTSNDDPELALEAMKMGAQDYMIKGKGDEFTLKRVIEYSIERKRFEAESAQKEEMLRTFFQHTPAAVAVFDREMRYLVASNRWVSDYRLQGKAIIGKEYYEVMPHAPERWRKIQMKCMQGNIEICPEDIFERTDGSVEWCRWEIHPWYEGDEVGGVIIFSEMTTEQKKMKQALEESKRNLEKKVEERTREIEKARQAAEASDRAKTELFTNLTHELRTPLHAIINFSKFGIKKVYDNKPEKLEGYFQDINKSGHRLLMLVNDILDLAKAQSMKLKLDIKNSKIDHVLDEVIAELSSLLDDSDMVVTIHNSSICHEAYFDKSRIIQVMINLMSNAIKFSNPGTVITIDISEGALRRDEEDSPEAVHISVIDQGSGIPKDELATIFDEFAQSNKVKSGSFSAGTGLGLAICKEIVHAHGGEIWAENNPDTGAKIIFTLPIKEEDTPTLAAGGNL